MTRDGGDFRRDTTREEDGLVGLAGRGAVSMGAQDRGRDRGEIWNDFEGGGVSLSLTGVESCFWTSHGTMGEEPTEPMGGGFGWVDMHRWGRVIWVSLIEFWVGWD
jgi:hypothetical protein